MTVAWSTYKALLEETQDDFFSSLLFKGKARGAELVEGGENMHETNNIPILKDCQRDFVRNKNKHDYECEPL